jgi:hypothetical protein
MMSALDGFNNIFTPGFRSIVCKLVQASDAILGRKAPEMREAIDLFRKHPSLSKSRLLAWPIRRNRKSALVPGCLSESQISEPSVELSAQHHRSTHFAIAPAQVMKIVML